MRQSLKQWCPIKRIVQGMIELKNGDFCKILEVVPINFALKSEREQEQILYQYKTFLKTCDFSMQILIFSKRYDIEGHIANLERRYQQEENEKVRGMLEKYLEELRKIAGNKDIISRKFYLVIRESGKSESKYKRSMEEIERAFEEKILKVKNSLKKTGNEVRNFERDDEQVMKILFDIFHRRSLKNTIYRKDLLKWSRI
ncbi:MAG: hypothetical protein J6M02_04150 [Clostridia bacterium]|nr:hypothetical protein [Clostridia bacterium]